MVPTLFRFGAATGPSWRNRRLPPSEWRAIVPGVNGALFLFGAGLLAGVMNALAGGGSFVTLPALIAAGVPSVPANASSTVALYPGGLASAWTYHERAEALLGGEQARVCGVALRHLLAVTLVGGLAGSILLLRTPATAFDRILPWLLLAATLAIVFARRISLSPHGQRRGRRRVPAGLVLALQFALGIYGGYFGGAVGLMMVAAWGLMGEHDIKALNAPRTLMVSAANTVAMLAFIIAGAVRWPETLAVLVGGAAGGYGGARLGRIVPARVTRVMVIFWTAGMTALFFIRAYLRSG
ncbi:MAG TPA: sulfite exporter TauE/SafE family protein [Acetobacteraceae bacterium]|nr:sulfite exporter TauE/SafE family protein [Acetobacteraceae bacterium]